MFDLSEATLKAHSLDMRQFIDAQQSTLPNGMRIINVHNSSGLNFAILPDRGFDIWTASYKGMPLTWISQGAPHKPDFGSPWLRQFNGGVLTTCGLRHAGQPETDAVTGEQRDLHGLYTRLPATEINIDGSWENDRYTLKIKGVVTENRLFGEQLRLERTYEVRLGEPFILIKDNVINLGDEPTPFMLLYHFNFGYPLVRQGTKLHLPAHASYAMQPTARAGFATWDSYNEATPGYPEQVFTHHLNAENHWSKLLLSNGDIGLELGWDTTHAPYFTQWKNTRQGIYVSGLEPGNCIPEGQNRARTNNRLVNLQPGEEHIFVSMLRIIEANDALQASIVEVENLGSEGQPLPIDLTPYT